MTPQGSDSSQLPPPPAGYRLADDATAPQLPPPPAGYKVTDESQPLREQVTSTFTPLYAEPRPPGAPVYQVAPASQPQQPAPAGGPDLGRFGQYAQFGRQLASGYYTGLGALDHLIGNISSMADAASNIPSLTGVPKLDIYKHIENWARGQQQYREQQAAEMSGGQDNLPAKLVRGTAAAVTGLPVMLAATALGGPVAGFGVLGGLENLDQGFKATLMGATEGALAGKFYQFVGPLGRPVKVPLVGLANYFQLRADGADPETAFSNAVTPALMSGMEPGTVPARETGAFLKESLTPRLPESLPESLRPKSTLNPVQQQASDYALEQGIPRTAGQITGNRYLQALEASSAHTPLGAPAAQEFGEGTQQALVRKAGELAGEVQPQPVTPYEGGKAASAALDRNIAELNSKENDAYGTAWQHAGDPQFDKSVPVRTQVEPVLDEIGQPTGDSTRVPVYKDVNMPVDVRWMKAIAQKEIPKYEFLSAAEQSQSKAYNIYKNILKGDDYITAEQAEEALKGFKAEARGAEDPNLRNVSQGASARMIPRLQQSIDAAVAETGQDSVAGLQAGRQLHAQKMEIADVSDKLREEPVQAFNQLTMAKDAGVDYLKQVAQTAPDVMPKLGRAYLDNLFDLATQEGGWTRARTVFNNWENLGDQTKALLFPEPAQRQALDRFFFAAKMIGEPINPSGTAMVSAAQKAGLNPFKWAEGWLGSRLLFTPRGIKFLTGIAQDPPQSASESAAVKAQAQKIFGPPTKPPEEPPEGPPTGGGPPTPPGGAGGAGGISRTPAHN